MDDSVFYFDGRGCVREKDAPVRFGWRNTEVAEIRAACVVKRHPQLETFHLQILKMDVALQVQGVQVFDSHRRQQPIDPSDPFVGRRIVEFDTIHLDGPRREGSVKISNFGAYAVICEGSLYLAGDVAVHKTQTEKKQDHEDYEQFDTTGNTGSDHCVPARTVKPTFPDERLCYTHDLKSSARPRGSLNSSGRDRKLKGPRKSTSNTEQDWCRSRKQEQSLLFLYAATAPVSGSSAYLL